MKTIPYLAGNTAIYLVFGLLLGLSACKKEVDPPQPNRPPATFRVEVMPALTSASLSWTTATDPDGDAVSYTVVLGSQTLVEDISQNAYELTGLDPDAEYSGSITASDPEGLSKKIDFSFRTEMIPNEAPAAFTLLEPKTDTRSVLLSPTLSWEASSDPDGDIVSYDVYLDQSATPSTLIAEDKSSLTHQLSDLMEETTYYWKVVAKDGKGGETESSVSFFTTRAIVTASAPTVAPWDARGGHTVVEFNGKLWVIGGNSCCGGRYNDVWSSADGLSWTEETASAQFPARTVHAATVYDGKIWISGGNSSYTSGNEFADVWSSPDGITWTEVTSNAAFSARYSHIMTSYGGKMWVFGGRNVANDLPTNQAWSSTDGSNWTLESNDIGIAINSLGELITHRDTLWYIGGYNDNVRWSVDGLTWTNRTNEAAFGDRLQHACVSHDDRMWLLTGSLASNATAELPDVWYSDDGARWIEAAANANFVPVAESRAVSFNGTLWLLGGSGGFQSFYVSNEIYSFE
ncbi:MAG: fibronectin type III domain-containing protein [Bacteroidota bacterium]